MHASLMLSWIFVQHCKLCCSPDREDLGKHRFSSCLMSQVACEPPQTGIHWWSEVVAWHSPEHVLLIFQSGKTRAEMEWQCSHHSEYRVDVKPRGLGNTVCVLKSLKQGEWAWESVGDMGSRYISITLAHMPVKSHYLTALDVSVLLNLLVASFSASPINY